MRILIGLTYFIPYKSGLTIYAVRQSQSLANIGHDVTVLTSQFDRNLPEEEISEGVKIHRLPVAFRLSKGVIMPKMLIEAWRSIRNADVINLHVPQVEAAIISILAKLQNKPLVLTYHCDLQMPKGVINRIAGWAAHLANHISALLADVIVQNTLDYAENSLFLQKYLDKVRIVKPPIVLDEVTEEGILAFKEKFNISENQKVIGMVARLATEKGVEYLAKALPEVIESEKTARVIFVGEYQNVIGEEAYKKRVMSLIESLDDRWTFLGKLSENELAIFYRICDVIVLPSVNNTESFGMVQIEAMTCGTPVIATDLPGVRQPVITTGMGEIIPIRDPDALAKAIVNLLEKSLSVGDGLAEQLKQEYSPENNARLYDEIFREISGDHG
jgi:glycosyltransferase involved in cell wall biosynthesis